MIDIELAVSGTLDIQSALRLCGSNVNMFE